MAGKLVKRLIISAIVALPLLSAPGFQITAFAAQKPSASKAQKPARPGAAIKAVYFVGGRFEQDGNANGNWTEYDFNNKKRYEFKEINSGYKTLTLGSADGSVRLVVDMENNIVNGEWPGHSMAKVYDINNVELFSTQSVAPPPPVKTPRPVIPTPPANIPAGIPAEIPPKQNSVSAADLKFASFDGGRIEHISGAIWTLFSSDGTVSYAKLGHDRSSMYLYDRIKGQFLTIDVKDRVIRTSTGGALKKYKSVQKLSSSKSTPKNVVNPTGVMSLTARAACLGKGGSVQVAGMLGAETCVIKYADGGAICLDSATCEGKCLTSADNAMKDNISGTCQMTDSPFGCYAEVRRSQTGAALCVD